MGVDGADIDESAVELMALSRRDRRLVAETTLRLGYLQPGDDIVHACKIVVEALRRGDAGRFWLKNSRASDEYDLLLLLLASVI
jgi:hypothetical protein